MIHFAIMGHGVVGSGVAEVFFKNQRNLEKKLGQELNLKYVLDLRDFPGLSYSNRFIKDFQTILADPKVSIVAELMGGLHPSYEFVKSCLEAGKSVVTSNKELVAEKGAELLAVAEKKHVSFLFEASVGGGIPIIRPLHQCLAANEINAIAGILNGTTNFILTKMIHEQMSFEDALALAQKLGYAERDPSADVDGYDSCRKISILASLAFGQHVYPKNVHTEGIRRVSLTDVQYSSSWGGVIKLIGQAVKREDGSLLAMVSPAFLDRSSQLAGVDDVFNGILVRGDATGDVVFYGKGAGKLPTASAVMADIIDAAKNTDTERTLHWVDTGMNCVCDYLDTSCCFFLRLHSHNLSSLRQQLSQLLGQVRELTIDNQDSEEIGVVTGPVKESRVLQIIGQLEEDGVKLCSCIRVLDF